ncbi:MAG: hypothetical protein P4L33_11750 [Capsulimonadaceae bacterium]|nr:hypothetical protein [Capsulimonadaceae bacterium]
MIKGLDLAIRPALIAVSLFGSAVSLCSAGSNPAAPPQAAAAGYTINTFHSVFNTNTVDSTGRTQPGFLWYPAHYYWMKPTDAASMQLGPGNTIILNSDGSPSGNNNTQICSMSPAKTTSGFVGMSFGGGGYFEATFSFDPDQVFSQRKKSGEQQSNAGWPSWWALSADPIIERSQVQSWIYYSTADVDPKYCNSVETDFFEYNCEPSDRDSYGGALHNWYGIYKYKGIHYPYEYGHMGVPKGADFTKPHKFGFLWVPARSSSAGKVRGYAAFYFDDKLVSNGKHIWEPYCGEAPPPTDEHPAFGVLDRQHLALILGSGVGEPMTVKSVNVWQMSDHWNVGADTLYDCFIDLKKPDAIIGPIGLDTKTPEFFDGHARRVKRTAGGDASLIYAQASIRSFAVQIFDLQKAGTKVTFSVSADKARWTTVKTRSTTVVDAQGGWSQREVFNAGALPGDAAYLRITLSGEGSDPGDCQVGQVRIN